MDRDISFGSIVKEHRQSLDLTQAELARRVACATITIRKIEYDALRPSIQIAERLATSLKIPLEERAAFVRLARASSLKTPTPQPLPTPPPAPEEIGLEDLSGRAIRGYELGDRMGEGGFGVVYRAVQPLVEREVAVKIILPRYADHPEFIRRFEAEAQLVARLEHPHIVPLYDYWREPGAAFLVMRLMRGGSLHSRIKDGPLSLDFILRLLNQVGEALYTAHRMGVIHRDLKPANILLDEDENNYLADFGVAKNLGNPEQTSDTMLAGIIGSPAYVSPEQCRAEPIRPQADIYALGILLFQLLTGQQPFKGPTPIDYVQQHLNQPTPPLLEYNPNLPTTLEPVLTRATAKSPEDRYPDIPSLVSDFQSAVISSGIDLPFSATLEWLSADQVDIQAIENPYKGLRAFEEADAEQFFGRETLVQDLLGRMSEENDLSRFLAVVGPSGSGKSSSVKAGLIPSLRRGGLPGSENWFIVEFTPGSHPYEELETALLRVAVNPPESLLGQLRQDERGLLRAVERILPPDKLVELVLVIDQFEELFTLVEDEAVRAAFLESLVTALLDPRSRLRVVITLRADFTDRPLEYVDFGELLRRRAEFVLPLTPDELEAAITQPARGAGLALEPGLSQRIIGDLGDQPGSLPLLQYALTELFERRSGRRLTINAYQDSGGVLGALGIRAETIFAGLDQSHQEIARQVFLRLVTTGEGVEDTRRRVLRQELETLPVSVETPHVASLQQPVDNVIEYFGKARLLSFDHDPLTRGSTVEVAHEALLREWSRLREWLEQGRADIRNQRVLGNAAADWINADRDPSFLLRGARLDQFAAWFETTDLALTELEREYLDVSLEERRSREAAEAERLAHEAALERRSRNFLRGLVAVLAVAAVVAIGLSLFAFNQQGIAQENALQADQNAATALAEADARATQQAIAEEQQAIAESEASARAEAEQQALDDRDRAVEAEQDALVQAAIGLAGQASKEIDGSFPERSVPLALEALEDYPYTWQAHRALGEAVMNHHLERVFEQDDVANTFEISQDGERILIGSKDGTAKVLRSDNGEELLVLTEDNPTAARWSPDESSILTIGGDGFSIKLWDSETGSLLFSQEVDSNINYHPWNWSPWSPQGERFVTAHDGGARIWDAATGTVISLLSKGEVVLFNANWSPFGDYIVTPGDDNTAILWGANTGQIINTLPGTNWGIRFGSWSPDGDRFALRGLDRVTIYKTNSGDEVLNIFQPGLWTQNVRFSHDGTKIITTIYEDGTARLYNAETGKLESMISGLTQGRGISWSPSGDLACIVGANGTIRIWDINTGLVRHNFPLFGASYCEWSPEGDKIYVSGEDTIEIRIFELSSALQAFKGNPGIVGFGAWSPDGQQFGRGFNYGPTKVWNAVTGEDVFNFDTGADGESLSPGLNWSPSGDRILTWNADGTTRIWDASTSELLLEFSGIEGGIFYGDWSPDGTQIVTSGTNAGEVTLWDSETGEQIWQVAPSGGLYSFAKWSPDGKRIIATGSHRQGTIRDASTGEEILNLYLEDHPDWVEGAAWSHDGEKLVIFSYGAGKIFDPTTGEVLLNLSSGHTSSAWDVYWSPTDEYIYTLAGDGTYRVFDANTGIELLVYETGGWPAGSLSPDGTQMLIGFNDGSTSIFPTWGTPEELIAYARECCVLRELTPEERELFGLPPR
jgi:WD40 repeat protein/serine/threonine protein kinase/DNA-binding XRE family transcriptional regulator